MQTASCLTCDFCKVHDYFHCTNTFHVDQLEERDIQLQTLSHAPITHAQLQQKALDIPHTVLPGKHYGAIFSVILGRYFCGHAYFWHSMVWGQNKLDC